MTPIPYFGCILFPVLYNVNELQFECSESACEAHDSSWMNSNRSSRCPCLSCVFRMRSAIRERLPVDWLYCFTFYDYLFFSTIRGSRDVPFWRNSIRICCGLRLSWLNCCDEYIGQNDLDKHMADLLFIVHPVRSANTRSVRQSVQCVP